MSRCDKDIQTIKWRTGESSNVMSEKRPVHGIRCDAAEKPTVNGVQTIFNTLCNASEGIATLTSETAR